MVRVFQFTTVAALLVASGSAFSAPQIISFDNFSILQPTSPGVGVSNGYLTDSTRRLSACNDPQFGGPGAVTRTGSSAATVNSAIGTFKRSISINLCNGTLPRRSQVGVNVGGGGLFEVLNDAGDTSVGVLRYDLTAVDQFRDEIQAYAAANNGINQIGFIWNVITSDANSIDVHVVLDKGLPTERVLGVRQIGQNFTGPFLVDFSPTVSLTGTLDLIFTGAAGYDIGVRSLGFYLDNTDQNVDVDAPAALLLLGLGFAGVGLARRAR